MNRLSDVSGSYVYLRVVSDVHTLEELTSRLGPPDSGYSKGDRFRSGAREGVRAFSSWQLHARPKGASLDDQLAELFPRVRVLTDQDIEAVRDLAITLEIVQYLDPSDSATFGIVLEQAWLSVLVDLDASVDVDQYLTGPE